MDWWNTEDLAIHIDESIRTGEFEMIIPEEDKQGLRMSCDDGTGRYTLYKDARPGWRSGFLVVTKASQRAKRRVKHVETESAARQAVEKFMES